MNLESLLKRSIHQLLRDFHTTQSLSLLQKSPWHLQPLSQRSILNSWIIYQSPLLDSPTASHIHPKRTSAKVVTSCFICVQVHGFASCIPTFCKKGLSLISTAENPSWK